MPMMITSDAVLRTQVLWCKVVANEVYRHMYICTLLYTTIMQHLQAIAKYTFGMWILCTVKLVHLANDHRHCSLVVQSKEGLTLSSLDSSSLLTASASC